MDWCTIESDPGVFSELIATVGVKDVKVEELYDLEGLGVDSSHKVYGLIFLFKWRSEREDRPIANAPGLFFAKQVITNACATQAILSVLMNADGVDLGDVLGAFKSFTADFPPELKGEAIGNCQPLREAHNSFARPEPFEVESKEAQEDDDVFHFIGYVPFNGAVYELDGLKPGPIKLADIPGGANQSWLNVVRPLIQSRIARYQASEIRFNLLEVTQDLRRTWKARIAELENLGAADQGGVQPMDMTRDATDPAKELDQLRQMLAAEEEKFTSWKEENMRRRWNYVPFILAMLKTLGERGHLIPLLEAAQEKEKAKAKK